MKLSLCLLRFLLLSPFTLLPAAEITPDRAKPNIVFFLADDLGQRDLGCYGSTFYETPNIDRLARDGARFTQAYAAGPVCSPTRASIMTGQWPARTGITEIIGALPPEKWKRNTKLLPAPSADRLPADSVTLAQAMKAAGYATFFAGKWHLGPDGHWPEDHGFEINIGGTHQGYPASYFSPYKNARLPDGPAGEHLPDRLASETAQWIQANRGHPFFACFSLYDVHTPFSARDDLKKKYEEKRARLGLATEWGFEPPRNVRLTQDSAVYAAMVEAMDLAVGKVLAKIDELGLRENTLVVFTSDNGGLSTNPSSLTSNLPFRAGKGWLYEGGIREPLIVRWPGIARAGTTIDTPVSSPDFFPTLLEAAGAKAAPGQTFDGMSLAPLLKGGAIAERPLFWHFPHYNNPGGAPAAAIRRGDWKLIEWHEDNRPELYNLVEDIGERTDRSARDPARTRQLLAELHAWQKSVGAKSPAPNANYDPAKPDGRSAAAR